MKVQALGILITSLVMGAGIVSYAAHAYASLAGPLYGYAWSDTIGWVSFNCADTNSCSKVNYSVQLDASGNVTGYAWSDNIGWVQAYSSDSGCPQTPCRAQLVSGKLQGWMKALAADGRGWDGWISLSGSNYGPTFNNTTGSFSGYAWGSDVVGWLDFSRVTTDYRSSCTETDICADGKLSHQNPDCSIDPVRTCLNGCKNAAQCNPECNPTYSCSGNTIMYQGTDCNWKTVKVCPAPSYCVNGDSECTNPPPAEEHDGDLRADPRVVAEGTQTFVHWDMTNVTSCTVSGTNGDSWTVNGTAANGWVSTSGSTGKQSSPISQKTTYTMVCHALDGVDPSSLTESVDVIITPVFQEK